MAWKLHLRQGTPGMFSPNGKFFAAFEQNQPNVLVHRAVVILRGQQRFHYLGESVSLVVSDVGTLHEKGL